MPLLTNIEKIVYSVSPIPPSIKPGSKLTPKDILILSDRYKELNLREETALLVSMDKDGPKYLLTDKYLYINKEKIVVPGFNTQLLDGDVYGFLDNDEKYILKESIALLNKEKTDTGKTIDNFINKYKKILNQEKENFQNKELFFDGQYIELLQHETEEIIKLCSDLNSDPHFIQSINLIFSSANEAVDGYKAEHVMISDIIKAYNQVALNENEKSKFTLAYFFDCLQGKDLAKGISIQRLNQMATNESFLQNIEKIKTASLFS